MSELTPTPVSPDHLRRLLDNREAVAVLDVRPDDDYRRADSRIPGAVRVRPGDLDSGGPAAIRQDVPVVVYSTGPDEAAAVAAARRLLELGWQRAHPLLGGFEAYLSDHPVEPK